MDIKELEDKKLQIEKDIINIKAQLEESNYRYIVLHQSADYGWVKKAKYALEMKKLELKETNLALQAEKRNAGLEKLKIIEEEKTKRTASVERTFMNIAKEKLPQKTYNEILRVALKLNNMPVRAKCSECSCLEHEVKANRTYRKCEAENNKKITKAEYEFSPEWCPLNHKVRSEGENGGARTKDINGPYHIKG